MRKLHNRVVVPSDGGFFYDDAWESVVSSVSAEAKTAPIELPDRWAPMNLSPAQRAYYYDTSRFVIVPAGRRTGKSEIAKRRGVRRACGVQRFDDPLYVFAAPTHGQAKKIFWRDLKRLAPKFMVQSISEGELTIRLINNAELRVTGLDVPERLEGVPIDGITIDEYGNVKPDAWPHNIRPALADRQGWADIIGVPEGRNHYWEMWNAAQDDPSWSAYHWTSEEVLPLYLGVEAAEEEIRQAKRDLDQWSYEQEYLASFKTFSGRAYYGFSDENVIASMPVDSQAPLCLCLDFNVEPGVLAVVQEFPIGTVVLDEIYIERDSNTEKVVRAFLNKYSSHAGPIWLYGDPAGGHRRSSALEGSDWQIVRNMLHPVYGDRISTRVDRADPGQRLRINATNARCCSVDGTRRLFVCKNCKQTIRDFEGVTLADNGLLELDKSVKTLTHLTDAIAYYIVRRHGMPSATPKVESRAI